MSESRYTKDGWVDMHKVYTNGCPWCILVGARQIGKTYGAIKELMLTDDFFIFLRRTEDELESIQSPELDPFSKPSAEVTERADPEKPWKMFRMSRHAFAVHPARLDDNGNWQPDGPMRGMCFAVSTYAKVRGFAADKVKTIIYDEFIPEPHVRKITREGWAVMNIYESVNSNRELFGRDPVKFILMANSNTIANPVMMQLNLVEKADKLEKQGQHVYRTKDLYYCNYSDSPISARKMETVLYRLNKDNDFSKMAINSLFSGDERGNIKPANLRDFKPLVNVGELSIYQHRQNNSLYCCMHKSGSVTTYPPGDISYKRFRIRFNGVLKMYLQNRIQFETYTCELYLREVLALD